MSEWQKMHTAPKDGTLVLCLNAETGEIRVAARKLFSDMHFKNTGRHWYEWFCSDKHAPGHTWSIEPTHWMPLPEPPNAD